MSPGQTRPDHESGSPQGLWGARNCCEIRAVQISDAVETFG